MPSCLVLSLSEMSALVETDDLLARARAGESEAWGRLAQRSSHRVLVALLAEGFRLDESQDLAQEAWTAIWLKHQRGEFVTLELPGLVIAHARFLAKNLRRRSQRPGPQPAEPEVSPGAERRLGAAQALRRVQDALKVRSAQQQRIFRDAVEELRPHAAIAEAEGLSVQRVRQILWEVRRALRIVLEPDQEPP